VHHSRAPGHSPRSIDRWNIAFVIGLVLISGAVIGGGFVGFPVLKKYMDQQRAWEQWWRGEELRREKLIPIK
jgi:hypothetical protein